MLTISPKLLNVDRLKKWMDDQSLGEGELENLSQLAGGTQNILIKFERANQSYVLRRPPEHLRGNSNETMRREARVLAALSGSKVPHPTFIAGSTDDSIIGANFYLMEAVDGFNPAQGLPQYHANHAQVRAQMGPSMVEAIAHLAKLDFNQLGLNDFGKVEGYLDRQVGRWQKQLDSYAQFEHYDGPNISGLSDVANWLAENTPKQWQAGIIHGDYHIANVMFQHDSPSLAAVVDWELSTLGDPLIDLGWLMATWPSENGSTPIGTQITPWTGFANSAQLVDYYALHSIRDLSQIEWYAVLACYKLGIILEGTHARACAGKAPKEIGDMLHQATLSLFERALGWIN